VVAWCRVFPPDTGTGTYSLRKDSTGFIRAALILWKPTVSKAMPIAQSLARQRDRLHLQILQQYFAEGTEPLVAAVGGSGKYVNSTHAAQRA
jgi:hypothetical protein